MEFFNESDFADMKITRMVYDEETRGWTFFVEHGGFLYDLKDSTLPHPDELSDEGHIASVVQKGMLSVQNKSQTEKIKTKIEIQNVLLEKPISDLTVVEYVKPEETELLEYDGPGYENFFLDKKGIYKGNINIILDPKSNTWVPGRYTKSLEWSQYHDYRIVYINGEYIKLDPIKKDGETKAGSWEYWDGPVSMIFEFNGRVTKDILFMGDTESKYNVHLLLNADTMTWNYGPNNKDEGWMGEGQSIIINDKYVTLSTLKSEEGYTWSYYKQKM